MDLTLSPTFAGLTKGFRTQLGSASGTDKVAITNS
jgi:hypothetical protein